MLSKVLATSATQLVTHAQRFVGRFFGMNGDQGALFEDSQQQLGFQNHAYRKRMTDKTCSSTVIGVRISNLIRSFDCSFSD